MSQRPRLSTEACDQAEEVCDRAEHALDYWFVIWEDGRIDPEEAEGMTLRLTDTVVESEVSVSKASYVDQAEALSVAMIRCGPNSPRVTRLQAEHRQRIERAANEAA